MRRIRSCVTAREPIAAPRIVDAVRRLRATAGGFVLVFPGMDEPERVYELAIDGVEAPEREAPAPESGDAESTPGDQLGVDELTKRMTEKINARVYEALERSLGKLGDKLQAS